jgi:hypothetical protein
MGSTAILARLLMPADFGIVAMVSAITGLLGSLGELGLSSATVQRAEITHEQVSTLFWINFAFSLLISGVVAALAPAIAWFYHEPRLTAITLVSAGSFIFGGLTIQHYALLTRQISDREHYSWCWAGDGWMALLGAGNDGNCAERWCGANLVDCRRMDTRLPKAEQRNSLDACLWRALNWF